MVWGDGGMVGVGFEVKSEGFGGAFMFGEPQLDRGGGRGGDSFDGCVPL